MTTKPSMFSYDLRDPLEVENRKETIHCSVQILSWVLIIAGFVLILHLTIEPKLPRAEAALVDDKVLCSNPLTESVEVGKYCYQLMVRGL